MPEKNHARLAALVHDLLCDVPYLINEKKGFRHTKKAERVTVEAFTFPEKRPVVWLINPRMFPGLADEPIDFEKARRSHLHPDRPLPEFAKESTICQAILGLCELLVKIVPAEVRKDYQERITTETSAVRLRAPKRIKVGPMPKKPSASKNSKPPKARRGRVIRLLGD